MVLCDVLGIVQLIHRHWFLMLSHLVLHVIVIPELLEQEVPTGHLSFLFVFVRSLVTVVVALHTLFILSSNALSLVGALLEPVNHLV